MGRRGLFVVFEGFKVVWEERLTWTLEERVVGLDVIFGRPSF